MPFCSNCGKFSVSLTDQKLCKNCETLLATGKISEERFRARQSRLNDDVSMSLLHYRSENEFQNSQPDSPTNRQFSEEAYFQEQNTSTSPQSHDELEGGMANLALGLITTGYLLLFLDFIFISAFINVCGLITAIIAKRREVTRNWRPQVALGVGIMFWAAFILYNVIKLAGF